MSYFGLIPFLLKRSDGSNLFFGSVSMSFLGLIPFLLAEKAGGYNEYVCQCPISDLFHFYVYPKPPTYVVWNCVNVLSRTYSISTRVVRK